MVPVARYCRYSFLYHLFYATQDMAEMLLGLLTFHQKLIIFSFWQHFCEFKEQKT